jgi:hypothetical protein
MTQTTLSIPISSTTEGASPTSPSIAAFPKKQRRIWTLPGLTGPVILVAPAHTNTAGKGTFWRDILSVAVDVFELRGWRDMDPIACFMMATYTAVITQPVVYGSLGTSIVAMMTPVK